jgi:sulfur-carrier protein adenylyltransferase/sulfurtransferase
LLKEVGAAGQAALAEARVLVVGLGGLGSPVLQYLAGAGVGTLGLIDADVLDASNLHRQPLYAAADVGKPKVELARAALQALRPTLRIETHPARFDADNALSLTRDYDLIVDCSDNFRTKYLINDAAVLTQRAAVFASVYQYEGQLQVYRPAADHACLRCLWPDAIADGVVGNCAEAGVLGPVPGALGSMQALLVLKLLLKMSGVLSGELLLLDFTNFSSTKLRAPRRKECLAPGCAHVQELQRDDPHIELKFGSLTEAVALGFDVVDIRSAEEFSAQPSTVRHIPMSELLANPGLLPQGREILLMCASGKRSLSTARLLRRQGKPVRSLAGGFQNLEGRFAIQE